MPEHVIDFSVNVNPLGPPSVLKEQWGDWFDAVADYPDPQARELTRRIACMDSVTDDQVLLGNGGAELIQLIGGLLREKRVLLIQPTFSEYEQACRAHGCEVDHYILEEGTWSLNVEHMIAKLPNVDAVFLCHPNNPTGITYEESTLIPLVEACEQHDCLLIIDEAFYDFQDDAWTAASMLYTHPHLIILRSLTKMYAIAGLRLGYVLAAPEIISTLKNQQPHWSVNAIAQLAGKACLQADRHVTRTRDLVQRERAVLLDHIEAEGYLVSNSKVNFFVLRDPALDDQLPLLRYLLEKGIVPRHTLNYTGLNGRWLRFSVRLPADNALLLEALIAWKKTT